MPSAIVFWGEPSTAHVVAGFLRASGVPMVEVIPPTPYSIGPLRHGMVRVLEGLEECDRLLNEVRMDQRTPMRTYAWWERLVAASMLVGLVLTGF